MSGAWHGPLTNLGATLRDEALSRPHRWAWRALARGAVVACRVHPQYGTLQFRIARPEKPAPQHHAAWLRELRVLEQHLGLEGWQTTHADTAQGGVEALYLSPEPTLFGPHAAAERGGSP